MLSKKYIFRLIPIDYNAMKKLLFLFVCFILASCVFTEEVTFNSDQSGQLSIGFDGSEFMKMMGGMNADQEEKTVKKIDSLVVFSDILEASKDSIARLPLKEQEELMKLKPYSLRIQMDESADLMKFEMLTDFEQIEDVSDAFKTFSKSSVFGDQRTKGAPIITNDGVEIKYSFKGNRFERQARIKDAALFNKALDSLKDAAMILSASTYKMKYNFPVKVKSVSYEGASLSSDLKSVSIEVNFQDLTTNPERYNFTVILEQ
jgi:hypothetical protein